VHQKWCRHFFIILIPEVTKDRIKCNYCTNTFKTNSSLYWHSNNQHQSQLAQDWIQCVNCLAYFPTHEVIVSHQSVSKCTPRERNIKYTQCEFCPRRFSRAYLYYTHAKVHSEEIREKWLMCELCKNYFPDHQALVAHSKSHNQKVSKKKKVKCQFCTVTVGSKYQGLILQRNFGAFKTKSYYKKKLARNTIKNRIRFLKQTCFFSFP